jgi:two-component system CheB/CheR fusion protein
MPPGRDPGPMGCTRAAGRTVLVIDDDDGVRSTIRAGLETLGLRALVAADAEAGLQLLKTTEPDLVLCDLQMPGLDGFGFMARVRETPSLGGMPIVALSGQGSLADIARSQALGFRAHLVKPLSLDVLRRLLEVLLERLDL